MAVRHYQRLIVCQKSMDLVENVYRATRQFPIDELYGPTNQVRRSAVSILSNIAEGQGRAIGREFLHHLRIGNGSRREIKTQILIAGRLSYLQAAHVDQLMDSSAEVGRLISGLMKSI